MTVSWLGFEVDDLDGRRAGRVRGFFADAERGDPAWLVVDLARRLPLLRRRRGGHLVAVPMRDCAWGGGRVWTAHPREELRHAPTVDPTRPLLREHELAICSHYGIGERVGRAAEVVPRAKGAVTAQPA
ncbi:MAG TPA: hypothetical protein VHF50_01200 [Solirubrobacterales bacterium]|nr:hypothetical protein [Solirubrobacterales bacterium]